MLVDNQSGKITCTIAKTKSGQNFLAFLIALVTAYAGRKVRLVCDNGRFHQTKVVLLWLKTHRDQVQVFWLPPYCPSLTMIERLWGHIKRRVLANVLFVTMDDLVAAFRCGIAVSTAIEIKWTSSSIMMMFIKRLHDGLCVST